MVGNRKREWQMQDHLATIRTSAGRAVHVRRTTNGVVEVVGLEVIGELSLPRAMVPQLIAALQRALEE